VAVGSSLTPSGTPTWLDKFEVNVAKFSNNWNNNSTVVSPNNTGSVAFLEPKYNSLAWITKLEVSIFTLSRELKLMLFGELNNIWSVLLLNNSLSEFRTIWLPVYSWGDMGSVE